MSNEKELVSLDDLFGIDEDSATNGVWVNYGKAKIKVGFMGEANKNFVAATEAETRPYKALLDNNTLSNEQGRLLMARIMARGVIYGWEGIKEPFSFEACVKALLNKNSTFFPEMKQMAERLATFRTAELKEDAGNSTGASSAP